MTDRLAWLHGWVLGFRLYTTKHNEGVGMDNTGDMIHVCILCPYRHPDAGGSNNCKTYYVACGTDDDDDGAAARSARLILRCTSNLDCVNSARLLKIEPGIRSTVIFWAKLFVYISSARNILSADIEPSDGSIGKLWIALLRSSKKPVVIVSR